MTISVSLQPTKDICLASFINFPMIIPKKTEKTTSHNSSRNSDSLSLSDVRVPSSKLQGYWSHAGHYNEKNRVLELIFLKEVGRSFKHLLLQLQAHQSLIENKSTGQCSLCCVAIAFGRGWVTHYAILSYIHSELRLLTSPAQKEGRLGKQGAQMFHPGKCYESKNSLSVFILHRDLEIFGSNP